MINIIYSFLFDIKCSCKDHKYKNILSITWSFFIIPAIILLSHPVNILSISSGCLVLLLTTTSITYHLTHIPIYHCIDVITLWLCAFITTFTSIYWLILNYNIYLIIALIIPFISLIINFNNIFYDNNNLLKLKYHIFIHFANIISLIILGIHNIYYN